LCGAEFGERVESFEISVACTGTVGSEVDVGAGYFHFRFWYRYGFLFFFYFYF